jgi:hypothetical protein
VRLYPVSVWLHEDRLYRRNGPQPQADGQSEQTNQTIEIALRHLVNSKQDDWARYIGEIQLSHNNAVNISTGMVPNDINDGISVQDRVGPSPH